MNRESNTYTIVYAAIMVALVAVALAFTSQVLKAPQEENIKIDKMEQILRSVHQVAPSKKEVTKLYRTIIKQELLINANLSCSQPIPMPSYLCMSQKLMGRKNSLSLSMELDFGM